MGSCRVGLGAMSTLYLCPSCHAPIPPEDVNVGTDLALCRTCGKTTAFSSIAGVERLPKIDLSSPPPHVKVGTTADNQLLIIYKRISPIVYFLIPFTLLWSGMTVGITFGQQLKRGFDLQQSLFALPFLFGSLPLLAIIVHLLCGRWEIRAGDGSGSVFVGVGSLGWRRAFEYSRASIVSLQYCGVESNGVRKKAVTVTTNGKDFKFGALIEEPAKNFIAASLEQLAARA